MLIAVVVVVFLINSFSPQKSEANEIALDSTFFTDLFDSTIGSSSFKLSNLTVVNPTGYSYNQDVLISSAIITSIQPHTATVPDGYTDIDLTGYTVYPSLVNAHDHINLNWMSHTRRFIKESAQAWISDLPNHASYLSAQAEKAHFDTFYKNILSAYKQIFSGVTAVDSFQTTNANKVFISVRQPNAYYTHSVYFNNHDPSGWDLALAIATVRDYYYGDAVATGGVGASPWFIHVEEGVDAVTKQELDALKDGDVLKPNTVLVHALGFDDQDALDVASAGASIVWVPYSVWFITDAVADIRTWLDDGINVAMGTDSQSSGSVNMLNELRFAKDIVPSLTYQEIMTMATINGAKAMQVNNTIGTIEVGKDADMLIARTSFSDPYESFVKLASEDIVLLLRNGRPLYGDSSALMSPFYSHLNKSETVTVNGVSKFIVGYPTTLINNINTHLGYNKNFEYMPYDKDVSIPALSTPVITSPNGGSDYSTTQPTITLSGTVDSNANNVLINWSETPIALSGGQTTWSQDIALSAGVNYFEVRAEKDDTGSGIYSNFDKLVITYLPLPSVPSAPTVSADSYSQISISWPSVSDATSYYIYRSDSPSGTYSNIGFSSEASFTDTGLSAGTTYNYKISAVNSNGESSQSTSASAKTTILAGKRIVQSSDSGGSVISPLPPTNLSAVAGAGQVKLIWDASSTVDQFYIFRRDGEEYPYLASVTSTLSVASSTSTSLAKMEYIDSGLENGTSYSYLLSSVDALGNMSDPTDAVSATPTAPLIPVIIKINNGQANTTNTKLSLSIEAKNASNMLLSEDKLFTNATTWAPYVTSTSWITEASEGLKTIYVKFKNKLGEISKIISDDIFFGEIIVEKPKVIPKVTEISVAVSEGDLVKTPDHYNVYVAKYINDKRFRRVIANPNVFNSYKHFSWKKIKMVPSNEINYFETSDLVRAIDDPRVYLLVDEDGDNFTKQWVNMTYEQFITSGYDPDAIFVINIKERDVYTTGEDILYVEPLIIKNEPTATITKDTNASSTDNLGTALVPLSNILLDNYASIFVSAISILILGLSALWLSSSTK